MTMNIFYAIDDHFLTSGKYLWDKKILTGMFKKLKEFKRQPIDEAKEESLDIFINEMHESNDNFIKNIKNLPLIMKCRTMCDDSSHFGGQECAEYMRDVRKICETYLQSSIFSDNLEEGSIANIITKIRNKSRIDEKLAWEIERENKKTYDTSGKDNTLLIFIKSGYNI